MIRPLRKRHLQIWTLLALLLPALSAAAYLLMPSKVTDELILAGNTPPLPDLVGSAELTQYKFNIRRDGQGNSQLECIIKIPLTVPSLFIYEFQDHAGQTIDENTLIGTVGTKGIYRFDITKKSITGIPATSREGFLLYDVIHKQVIDTIIITEPQ